MADIHLSAQIMKHSDQKNSRVLGSLFYPLKKDLLGRIWIKLLLKGSLEMGTIAGGEDDIRWVLVSHRGDRCSFVN